jgi:prevent-host-death family protein
MAIIDTSHALSVSEAASRGVSGLLKAAEAGDDVVVARHGRAVAAVVSTSRLAELQQLEDDLRDAALAVLRVANDNGRRTSLDEVIDQLGLDRATLEAELADERAAARRTASDETP